MKLLYGLNNNALLCRDETNTCHCTFGAECTGELKTSIGTVIKTDTNTYLLTGIPTGGPYTVTLSDDTDSLTLTLWVGDLWLLGGQSNMEGAGLFTASDFDDEAHPNPAIRAYYADNRWDAAVPLLHEPWISVDACQREVWKASQLASVWHSEQPEFISHGVPKRGIGPGLFFAQKLYELSGGVPQAVIPCALGGSGMMHWDPDAKEDNLYHAMIRRVQRVGGKVRGLFWYQGCAECYDEGITRFHDRMVRMVECVRRDCHDAALPFVQVQIAKNNLHWNNSVGAGMMWEGVREKQRTLYTLIPHMDTVAAIDAGYADLIHLSTESQEIVGQRGALSMAHLCGFGGAPAPKLKSMELRDDECRPFCAVLAIRYENVTELISVGAPEGFTLTETPDELVLMPSIRIARIGFDGDTVLVYTELSREELSKYYIRYGYLNMGHCSIGDINGHLLPAMGPLRIADYL